MCPDHQEHIDKGGVEVHTIRESPPNFTVCLTGCSIPCFFNAQSLSTGLNLLILVQPDQATLFSPPKSSTGAPKQHPALPSHEPWKERALLLNCGLQPLLCQCIPDDLDTYIQIQSFLEFSGSISCSRGVFLNKGLSVLGESLVGHPPCCLERV